MGCRPCARIILVSFNILFFICGALLLAFGITGLSDPAALTRVVSGVPGVENASKVIDIPATLIGSATFMIILGGIMLVFGFFGCVGAWCMAKWMLFIYWFVLVLILLAEVALIIVAAVSPSKAQSQVKDLMVKSLREKFMPISITGNNSVMLPPNALAVAWISMQFEVGCCGANNYTDYDSFNWNKTFIFNGHSVEARVPPSCCMLKTPDEVPKSIDAFVDIEKCLRLEGDYNSEGCYKNVTEMLVQYRFYPIVIAAVVIFIEIVAIAAAVYLWKSNEKKKELV